MFSPANAIRNISLGLALTMLWVWAGGAHGQAAAEPAKETAEAPAAAPAAPAAPAEAAPAEAEKAAPATVPATTPPATEVTGAVITKVTGKSAQYSVDDGKSWKPAEQGVKLPRNGLVRTGFGSQCELTFDQVTIVQVQSLSSVRIADYSLSGDQQTVNTSLRYGAVRCGVEKGRVKADTKISTPVSTLSIRGTEVYVEYDAGTRRCMMATLKDGPAVAGAQAGLYSLDEGMRTDCGLSRFLELAALDRQNWIAGNYKLGEVTDTEAKSIVQKGFFQEPTEGHLEYDDPKSRNSQQSRDSYIEFPGGDIPIGKGTSK